MTKSRGIRKKHNVGDIIIRPDGTKWIVGEDRKWIYVKKLREEWNRTKAKPKEKWVPNFPPITLPDHIRATNYPYYYVSNDGVAYREPRRCDENGRFGEVNEYGLIELTTQLRGNPNRGKEFWYESVNIYSYDENNKNVGHKKRNIHQLVAEVWIPNPHGYNEVLHGAKGNRCNHYTNLRWGTHKENMEESSHVLPEGSIRRRNDGGSLYEKKDGKWVLIPSNKPVWNKGLKGVSWNTLPDGTVTVRKNGERRIKIDGEWIYIPKLKKPKTEKPLRKIFPNGTIRINSDGTKSIRKDGKWVYQKKERVEEVFETGTDVKYNKKGDKYKRINGKWVYQKKIKDT